MDADTLVNAWRHAKQALDYWKQEEKRLRDLVQTEMFPQARVGVNTHNLGAGFELKFTRKETIEVKQDKIEAAQEAITQVGNMGGFIADRLITWKASISTKELNEITAAAATSEDAKQILAIIQQAYTTKEGSPTLDLKEPPTQ